MLQELIRALRPDWPRNCPQAIQPSRCAKCGNIVPLKNSVKLFDSLRFGDSNILRRSTDWHLMPVKDGDEVVCEGSPSRTQYLRGFGRDRRSGRCYKQEREGEMRKAFALMSCHQHQ